MRNLPREPSQVTMERSQTAVELFEDDGLGLDLTDLLCNDPEYRGAV